MIQVTQPKVRFKLRKQIGDSLTEKRASPVLIVGLGNPLRGDDGVGPVLAERLAACLRDRGQAVVVANAPQLLPELAAEIAEIRPCALVIVDAEIDSPATGDGRGAGAPALGGADRLNLLSMRPIKPENTATGFTHQLSPGLLLVYAEKLFGAAAPAWLVTAPGVDFSHGATLSPTATAALAEADACASLLIHYLYE